MPTYTVGRTSLKAKNRKLSAFSQKLARRHSERPLVFVQETDRSMLCDRVRLSRWWACVRCWPTAGDETARHGNREK